MRRLTQELKNILDDLPGSLGYSGYSQIDNVEVEKARRSVHVYFKNQDFHIDVVPCIAPDGFDKRFCSRSRLQETDSVTSYRLCKFDLGFE